MCFSSRLVKTSAWSFLSKIIGNVGRGCEKRYRIDGEPLRNLKLLYTSRSESPVVLEGIPGQRDYNGAIHMLPFMDLIAESPVKSEEEVAHLLKREFFRGIFNLASATRTFLAGEMGREEELAFRRSCPYGVGRRMFELDEDEILEQRHDLAEYAEESQFKSYDELKKKYEQVIGEASSGSSSGGKKKKRVIEEDVEEEDDVVDDYIDEDIGD